MDNSIAQEPSGGLGLDRVLGMPTFWGKSPDVSGEDLVKLIEQLCRGDPRASKALGEAGNPYAMLINALEDDDENVRTEAEKTLGELGRPAVPVLMGALGDKTSDADIRRKAAWLLGKMKEESAITALIEALGDEGITVRTEARWALDKFEPRGRSDVTLLAGAVTKAVEEGRPIEGIVKLYKKWSGIMKMRSGGKAGQEARIKLLLAESSSCKHGAADEIKRIGEPAVSVLTGVLEDKADKMGLRQKAAWLLGEIGDVSAITALIGTLGHEEGMVRGEATWALEKFEPRSREDLVLLERAIGKAKERGWSTDDATRVREKWSETLEKRERGTGKKRMHAPSWLKKMGKPTKNLCLRIRRLLPGK